MPPPLPGHRVRCCYLGTWATAGYFNPHSLGGCEVFEQCLDPTLYDVDQEGLDHFCEFKCESPSLWDPKPYPQWSNLIDVDADGIPDYPDAGDVLWACNASDNPAILSTVLETYACVPFKPTPYGSLFDQVPSHGGTFTVESSPTNNDGVVLSIASNNVYPTIKVETSFALDQCDSSGVNGGNCRILLKALQLEILSDFSAGDYDVVDVSLRLSQPIAADIAFASCTAGECLGAFEFSTTNGNAIAFDLEWTQVEQGSAPQISEGLLHLGNDGTSLGSVDALYGELTLDPAAEFGTLRLIGSGEDALGGTLASISFDITGDIFPW